MNSVVWSVRARADVQAAQVGGDAVAAGVEGELVGPGADLRPVAADHQQGVLAGVGQVGDAELAVALVDPAGPFGEDVAEAVLRLRFFEGRVGDEVFAAAGGGRDQKKGDGDGPGEAARRRSHGGWRPQAAAPETASTPRRNAVSRRRLAVRYSRAAAGRRATAERYDVWTDPKSEKMMSLTSVPA